AAAPADIFSPPILSPNATTVWTVGAVETVTWDTSNAPPVISNRAGVILRRDNVNLATLASGFDLRAGSVDVTVPTGIEAATDYQIILLGDSGNLSPDFTIVAA
ncbi:hypothetical protein K488DRAFT_11326, partial [Vararia minispora EC-137]